MHSLSLTGVVSAGLRQPFAAADEQSLNRAETHVLNRLRGGTNIYVVLWLIVAYQTGCWHNYPALHLLMTGAWCTALAYRYWALSTAETASPPQKRFYMRTGFLFTAVLWGLTINLVGMLTGLSWSLAFCLCVSGVVGAISLSSLAPDYTQGAVHQIFRTSCDVSAVLLAEGTFSQKWPVVLLCVLYALYALRQGTTEYESFWRNMRAHRALEELQNLTVEMENCPSSVEAGSIVESRLADLLQLQDVRLHFASPDPLTSSPIAATETLEQSGHTLLVQRKTPLTPQEKQICRSFLNEASSRIARREMLEQLKQNARIDGLTQVSNRAYFLERATHSIKSSRRVEGKTGHQLTTAVLMLDIDHFKKVNDRYGHSAGDEVLKVVAQRCRTNLREVDLFARYGGEEFCALLVGSDREETAQTSAERLREAVAVQPVEAEGHSIPVTISIGVAQVLAQEDINSALKRADKALYQAKEAGRNLVMTA